MYISSNMHKLVVDNVQKVYSVTSFCTTKASNFAELEPEDKREMKKSALMLLWSLY